MNKRQAKKLDKKISEFLRKVACMINNRPFVKMKRRHNGV